MLYCIHYVFQHIISLDDFHSEFVKSFFTVGKIPFRDPPTPLSLAVPCSYSKLPQGLCDALTLSTTQSKLTFFSIHPFTSLLFGTLPHLNPKTCFSKALVSDVQKAQWCLMLVTFPSKKAFLHRVSLFDTHNNPFFFFLVGYEFDTHNQSILIDWTFSSLLQMRK